MAGRGATTARATAAGLALGLAVALTGCSSASVADDCGLAQPPAVTAPTGPMVDQPATGDPLPSVVVTDLADCTQVDTATWVGQPLVVNFWASWCGPCVAEMPELAAAATELEGSVRFVGVTFMDAPEDSRAFLEDVPVPYDVFVDAGGDELFRALQARGTPATVLVAPDGAVVFRHAGPITAAALADAIEEHLGVTA